MGVNRISTLNLASVLEDGTLLLKRYVSDNVNYRSINFPLLRDSDLLSPSPDGPLMTTAILKGNSKVSIVDGKTCVFGTTTTVPVTSGSSRGFLELRDIGVPEQHISHKTNLSLSLLGGFFRSLGRPVLLKIGESLVSNVIDAEVIDQRKSKVVILGQGRMPLLWLAQNKSGGPGAIDEYSEISERVGRSIYLHKEVQNFLDLIVGFATETQGKLDGILWRPVIDGQLVANCVFGDGFDSGNPGPNNCQVVGQGDVVLTTEDGGETFDLVFSEQTWISPDLSDLIGRYEPVLAAVPSRGAERGFRYKDADYRDFHVAMVPWERVRSKEGLQI